MNSRVWDQRYAGTELVWTSEPNRFLVERAAGLAPGRALDLACGEGRNALWLAERGWRVTGVDFSKVGIDKARELADARGVQAEWVVADLLDYTPEPALCELVIVFYLQVTGSERTSIVRRAASALAPGGTFLLVAHDSANIEHGYGGPQRPAVLYTAQDVVGDLEGTGLEIDEAVRAERPVQTDRGPRVALDALVRASLADRPRRKV
ncbi:MAG TPA: class I SAM-dependent methyltransferase [Solirubrobacteraceae bacterium]|jgi:SAM-dependent methyltransferase